MIKNIYISVLLMIFFSGCGAKVIKMNEHKDIKYSYHPHSSYELETKTYKDLTRDSQIEKKIERLSLRMDENINNTLNDILNNNNNSNIIDGGRNINNNNSNRNKGNLFNDRFDTLRLVR